MIRLRAHPVLIALGPLWGAACLLAYRQGGSTAALGALVAALLAGLVFAWRQPDPRSRALAALGSDWHDSPQPVLACEPSGTLRWANPAALEWLEPLSEGPLTPGSDPPRWLAKALGNACDHEPQRLELGAGRLRRTLQLRFTPLTGSGLLRIDLLDETPLRRQAAARRRAVSRYDRLFDASLEAVFELDGRGRVRRLNQRACRTLAVDAEAMVGRSLLDWLDLAGARNLGRVIRDARQQQQPADVALDFELFRGGRSAPDAMALPVTASVTPLPGEAGAVLLCCRQRINPNGEMRSDSSDDRFSRIFHSSPDAILIVRHADAMVLDLNVAFTRVFGYQREDAIGRREPELKLWRDPAERTAALDKLRENGESSDLEVTLRHADGTEIAAEINLRLIEIDGELCSLCIGRDIRERLRTERRLVESEQKFERVFSQSPDGIVIIRRRDLTIQDMNQAFVAASGYRLEELLGQSILDLDVMVSDAPFEEARGLLAEDDQFTNVEMTFRTRSGEEIPALVSAAVIELKGEDHVLCMVKDVSRLRQTELRLRQSEERFRGAFENAPIGILLVDLEGTIFQANRFAQDLLTYDDDLEGVHISRLIPAGERGQIKDLLNAMADDRKSMDRHERRLACRDGTEIWTHFHAVLLRTEDGEPAYCIVQIADITDMKTSQQRMERMAFYDTLTDLANRRLFYDRLAHAISHCQRSGHLAALMYLDLDQFKRVNDTLGHETGDLLLQEVAARLKQCVRAEDTVGRPGGDEFTVLLYEITTPGDAGAVADNILALLRKPVSVAGHQLVVTPSIGITIIPEDGVDPNVVMKNADLAMYRAKENGRNTYQFFSEEMNTNAIKRLRTEYELRQALENDEFLLYYQPKVRLTDRTITGMECLVRWQHPERGLLAPGEFITVAEETGAIIALGAWIIEQACRDCVKLSRSAGRPLAAAVNLSPRQFRDPKLIATIRRSLRESGLPAQCLEIEITETMLMHDVAVANELLKRLHELGVRIAIDDFGTGYSSLSYLKKFPIDTVKVDRSFIMDIPVNSDDVAITGAVIAMAHRLNMDVVAEGVETQPQLDFLLENDCEYAQGYLFSRPVPADELQRLLLPPVQAVRGGA